MKLKSWVEIIKKKLSVNTISLAGRNNQGKITSYHRGGGFKKRYRFVDFNRNLINVPGLVLKIEKDPKRSAKIALVSYSNGLLSYILAPEDLQEGDFIVAGNLRKWELLGISRIGSVIQLKESFPGEFLYNIEMFPGKGGQLVRSAGAYAQYIKKYETENKVLLKLKSGEFRVFSGDCKSTIGIVSNIKHGDKIIGKAGNIRRIGKRPIVRGVAMNPVDHPHGGGEGKKSGRNKTPWGRITKGQRTRKKNKKNNLIIKRRK